MARTQEVALNSARAATATSEATATLPSPTQTSQKTPTSVATTTPAATATRPATATPTATPSATSLPCDERMPKGGLLTLVSRQYGLSRDYEPDDLVPLADYFGMEVTLGYPTEISRAIIEPLQRVIEAMKADGLAPQIVSGYRSYSVQSLAFQKWLAAFPDWGSNLSAPPGHSEHQLGTTVDFGSPELKWMLGEDYVQFHPAFAQTSEGQWLAEHATEFGFTMSYPEDAVERTTFLYEPWHFRYVGRELAVALASENLTLSEYLEREQPAPCIPDQ